MSPFATLPKGASAEVKPYKVTIPALKIRGMEILVQTCPVGPETYENKKTDRSMGLNHDWFSEAKRKWANEFKWEEQEKKINQIPQFMATIKDDDGTVYKVHFMGLFSIKGDAIPIAFFHGWPGSFLEFQKLFSVLKTKYGDDPAKLPYHLIAPSLIGFGLSDKPPKTKDFDLTDLARIMNKLMIAIGFKSGYVAQGGDIGSMLSQRLAQNHAECKALHLNFLPVPDPDAEFKDLTEKEQKAMERGKQWISTGRAYASEHATRPATIGLVLSSSPVAMLAWIGEKFLEWTDQDPDIDEILQSVSLYWLTESYPTSIYTYRAKGAYKSIYPKKPLGFSWFPYELMPVPKQYVESKSENVWFKFHDSGGHFAAMEKPTELAQDVEDFVAEAWPKVKDRSLAQL